MLQPQYRIKLSRNESWQMNRPHFHEDIEILLALAATGSGSCFVGDTLFPIRAGTLFLFPEATLHKTIAPSAYQRYTLHISAETLRQFSAPESDLYAYLGGVTSFCRQLDEPQAQDLAQRFRRLEDGEDTGFGADIRRNIRLMELLVTVFTLFDTAEEVPGGGQGELARILPIMNYVREHLAEPMSLDKLAGEFFINKYHMCRMFKSALGFSVVEYIIHCRVLRARELLRQGMRVQDVGELVGFQNNAHFIRTFGKLTGASPKRYAKEYLAGHRV